MNTRPSACSRCGFYVPWPAGTAIWVCFASSPLLSKVHWPPNRGETGDLFDTVPSEPAQNVARPPRRRFGTQFERKDSRWSMVKGPSDSNDAHSCCFIQHHYCDLFHGKWSLFRRPSFLIGPLYLHPGPLLREIQQRLSRPGNSSSQLSPRQGCGTSGLTVLLQTPQTVAFFQTRCIHKGWDALQTCHSTDLRRPKNLRTQRC